MASETEVAALIFDVVPGVMRLLRKLMRESARAELSIPQLRVLSHVSRGAATAADLAELQGVSLAAICKMVDGLEERGLIEREFRAGNRKQLFIRLTARGRTVHTKTREAAQKLIAAALAGLPTRERAQIMTGLQTLREALSDGRSSHSPDRN